jgi:iron-sulfur cluster repair protein YtfE (RIC family)
MGRDSTTPKTRRRLRVGEGVRGMNIQTFAEQIAVVQARHHEREKELLKLLRRVLYLHSDFQGVPSYTLDVLLKDIEKELD